MSRPLKNNCDYFPHDNNMRNHPKVKAVRGKFPNGYAIWVMLIEYLTSCDGNEFEYSDMEFEIMSGDFGFTSEEIKNVIDYCLKIEMIFIENDFVFSESLNERLAPVYEKRGKAKELSKKQQRRNGRFCGNNTDSTVVSVTETPQSKVKGIKLNKREEVAAPSLEMVLDYFKDNGYREQAARNAYEYYADNDWHDKNGNPVKNWKMKIRNNWFKDEDKIKRRVLLQHPQTGSDIYRSLEWWEEMEGKTELIFVRYVDELG